jgi:hypothetical protein
MRKGLWTKGIILGITLLFMGTSIGSSMVHLDMKSSTYNTKTRQSEKILQQSYSNSLFFTQNKGQYPTEVLFTTTACGTTTFFCKNTVVTVFTSIIDEQIPNQNTDFLRKQAQKSDTQQQKTMVSSIVTHILGANEQTCVIGKDAVSHYNNYFIGNNPDKWCVNVPNYQEVLYKNIYHGIDLRYYYQGNTLKYDYIIQPGSDPSQIMIRYEGVNALQVKSNGDLAIQTRFGELTEKSPVIYQQNNSVQHKINGHFMLLEPKVFTFSIDERYDHLTPLVIDPALSYSTYLGGGDEDRGWSIAVDTAGNAYVTGMSVSWDFPVINPYNGTLNGYKDIIIAKLNPDAGGIDSLVYSTYIGGSDGEAGWNIAVDTNGNAYVTGWTASPDFPLVNPYNNTYQGNMDVFVLKLSAEGNSLLYSTFFGGIGEDHGDGIAVDSNGIVSITGYTNSSSFPITTNAYDDSYNGGNSDAFVSSFDPSTGGISSLLYSTYLGGMQKEQAEDISVDSRGNLYICGFTQSADFPMNNSYDSTFHGGGNDSFIVKLNRSIGGENSLLYSTYLGGQSNDLAYGIAVSNIRTIYVTGFTTSTDFPMEGSFCDVTNGIAPDAFVTVLTADGKHLIYSTYLGGLFSDGGGEIDVDDVNKNAYVIGITQSYNFPTVQGLNASFGGVFDAFVAILSPAQTGDQSLIYSTYLGGADEDQGWGIAVDNYGDAYVTGYTSSVNFPLKNPFQSRNAGNYDVFISKFTLTGHWAEISKPLKSLYIKNIDLIQFIKENYPLFNWIKWPFARPWIFGNITIEASTGDDEFGIDHVEFFIDNEPKYNDTTSPYSWQWSPEAVGGYTIKIKSFSNNGTNKTREIKVWVLATG